MKPTYQTFDPMDFRSTSEMSDLFTSLDAYSDDYLDDILGESDMDYFYKPSVIAETYA